MKTGIQIKTGFFPLAWFLFFVTPTIEINGVRYKKSWGESFFELPPGEYHVRISFPYFGKAECGANEVNVLVSEGQSKRVTYNMPPWMLAKGIIRISH